MLTALPITYDEPEPEKSWFSSREVCNCEQIVGNMGYIPLTHQLGTASSTSGQARPNMNADDIIANDAHRDALRLSTTAFTRWGVAYPADPGADPAAVRELRV